MSVSGVYNKNNSVIAVVFDIFTHEVENLLCIFNTAEGVFQKIGLIYMKNSLVVDAVVSRISEVPFYPVVPDEGLEVIKGPSCTACSCIFPHDAERKHMGILCIEVAFVLMPERSGCFYFYIGVILRRIPAVLECGNALFKHILCFPVANFRVAFVIVTEHGCCFVKGSNIVVAVVASFVPE